LDGPKNSTAEQVLDGTVGAFKKVGAAVVGMEVQHTFKFQAQMSE